MADNTKIEWADATWNIITGCQVLSPGCTNCYAMRLAGTRLKHQGSREGLTKPSKAGPVWTGEIRFNEQWLDQPIRWKRPRNIFVCAHGDLFAEGVVDDLLNLVFAVMVLCPHHNFQVLTKRPERMRDYLSRHDAHWLDQIRRTMDTILPNGGDMRYEWPLPHVWIGTSVEDQTRADERQFPVADLAAGGWNTWVSYEPALGPVDWLGWEFLDWMVSGGESGPRARPSHPDWHRATRDWCIDHGVSYHFKQWGDWLPFGEIDAYGHQNLVSKGKKPTHWKEWPDGPASVRVGKKVAGRLLDGRTHDAMPMRSP